MSTNDAVARHVEGDAVAKHITPTGMTVPPSATVDAIEQTAPAGYFEWLEAVKRRVHATQVQAIRSANREIIRLYWSVGRDILERQEREGWGTKVIRRFSRDMTAEFPGMRGWSPTNLKYMRMFAQAWHEEDSIGQQLADQLPWGHVMVLLDKFKDDTERFVWYAQEAVGNGWSRAVLNYQIQVELRERVGKAPSNFPQTLESVDSDLAQQMVKDPYVFQQLGYQQKLSELELEDALMDRIQDTLMELGRGITFVGRQVRFTVDDLDLYVDLLFFHAVQLRYVVVELKVAAFKPEMLGQLGTYIAAVDEALRVPEIHAPTIGLLLCTGKRDRLVRLSLTSTAKPIAVAQWQGLPESARASLPSVEELEAVVEDELAKRAALASDTSRNPAQSATPNRHQPDTIGTRDQ
ncbi:MAG: PDDEXK nuclease domain-containing protein [Propionibacteriaceae bacterium]|jgi:predicted nuclease of restriction endonuclease-like (RecB) superfamily|nr:PDDEXK nuclease domain-containing protein [Propionibacteriaceae bacterium]